MTFTHSRQYLTYTWGEARTPKPACILAPMCSNNNSRIFEVKGCARHLTWMLLDRSRSGVGTVLCQHITCKCMQRMCTKIGWITAGCGIAMVLNIKLILWNPLCRIKVEPLRINYTKTTPKENCTSDALFKHYKQPDMDVDTNRRELAVKY